MRRAPGPRGGRDARRAGHGRLRGSSASRRPSPRRLNPSRILTGAAYLRLLLVAEDRQSAGAGTGILAAAGGAARARSRITSCSSSPPATPVPGASTRDTGTAMSAACQAWTRQGLDEALYWKTLRPPRPALAGLRTGLPDASPARRCGLTREERGAENSATRDDHDGTGARRLQRVRVHGRHPDARHALPAHPRRHGPRRHLPVPGALSPRAGSLARPRRPAPAPPVSCRPSSRAPASSSGKAWAP